MRGVKVVELMDGSHDIALNDMSTSFEEGTGKPVGAGSLVRRHLLDCLKHSLLSERFINAIQIHGPRLKFVQLRSLRRGCPFPMAKRNDH
jgi:hypothetical protein